ncbi:MAG: hypothetical protein KGN02_03905 [bacterium]|nr:hypothetical protein [bacterium]
MKAPALILSCITVVLAAGFSRPAPAAVPDTFSFTPVKAPHALALDAAMTAPAWAAARVRSDGAWENVTKREAADESTSVSVLYDDHTLYVGFVAHQAGVPITATQTTNDVGFGTDDFVAVGLDPSGAGSQTYLFEVTPRGVRYQQASENVRYRPEWKAATERTADGWRAVLAIPLDVMRVRPGSPQTWRMNFYRQVAAVGEHYSWAWNGLMQDQPSGSWPNSYDARFWPAAGPMRFAGRVSRRPKPRAELYGLASLGADRELFQQSDGSFRTQTVRSVGLDVSVPLDATINFVGTVNPDFSNVEVDQQTIAPQEFRRQLQEFRPFFAQGAQYLNPNPSGYSTFFSPQDSIFYSPSVGPFDRGAKVEGTYGLQSFGVLSYRGYNQITGDTFDDVAYGWKHALQNDTFQYWTDGVLAHHSVAGDDATVEGGFKGRNLHNGFVYSFDTSVERGSWVPQGVAHSTSGFVDVHKPNWEALIGYADIAPNYNPIDGFTENSDIRGLQTMVNFVGSARGIKNWDLNLAADRLLDHSGAVHESDTGMYYSAVFDNGFSLNGVGPTVSTLRGYNAYGGPGCTGAVVGTNYFSGAPCYLGGVTTPFNIMNVPIGYRDGTPHPIDASAGWGNFGSSNLHLYTLSTSRPLGGRMTLGVEYDGSYERDRMTGALDSQWLRRLSLGFETGSESNFTISLRSINGRGGFATEPGVNLAAAFHMQLRHGDLYINYGTPAANATLDRFIVKYVIRAGGDAGT